MIFIGIDIASKKHDCCAINAHGMVLAPIFTFENNAEGFGDLLANIKSCERDVSKVRVGVEATGHYGSNLISFLLSKGFDIVVFNPLQVDMYRRAGSLRKTKTDKADAKFIAQMLLSSNAENSSYTPNQPDIADLKALNRHRSRLKGIRARLRTSVSRLVTVLFPELCEVVWSIHSTSSYVLLLEHPTAAAITDCHLTKLSNLLVASSRGKYGKEKALEIKNLAAKSIGKNSRVIGFELQQTIRLINNIADELDVLDGEIKALMLKINSPITTIPGISYNLGSIILSEIGCIENFSSPSKLLAYAGLEPSTYQSGNYSATKTSMVKRGSPYLRWAILQAARHVSRFDPTFGTYAEKKRLEGKHHFVVLNHVGRKLIRVIFHILKHNQVFEAAA